MWTLGTCQPRGGSFSLIAGAADTSCRDYPSQAAPTTIPPPLFFFCSDFLSAFRTREKEISEHFLARTTTGISIKDMPSRTIMLAGAKSHRPAGLTLLAMGQFCLRLESSDRLTSHLDQAR